MLKICAFRLSGPTSWDIKPCTYGYVYDIFSFSKPTLSCLFLYLSPEKRERERERERNLVALLTSWMHTTYTESKYKNQAYISHLQVAPWADKFTMSMTTRPPNFNIKSWVKSGRKISSFAGCLCFYFKKGLRCHKNHQVHPRYSQSHVELANVEKGVF